MGLFRLIKKAQKNGNCVVNVSKITIDGLKQLINGGMEEFSTDHEFRKKCNVCGHVFCYRESDIIRNKQLAKQAKTSANLSMLNAVAGTRYDSYEMSKSANRAIDQIVDYSVCPNCNSSDLRDATDEEIKQAQSNNGNVASIISSADELKEFKELLDSGVITQEEFDAKKKQLLGL